MAQTTQLIDRIATRARSLDFSFLGMLLPNPDPILRAQGKSISVYRDMRSDPLIGSAIRRRKSAVKKLHWGLDRGAASARVAKAVQSALDGVDVAQVAGQMLDATLYGYQPVEVMWAKSGGLLVPGALEAKPPEWFCFDPDNMLRFRSRNAPMEGELLPERKFLVPTQDPTYQNPYGFADLSMCFWPLVFKKGGLKFWLGFAEKFGSAFSVGKLPRNASDKERGELLDSLEALINDGAAVIPDDGSIELVEMAGKSASADLYERLVMHCRSEISIALLGQNQTTEASANRASATAGLQVTDDLRDGDAEIVCANINQLIKWFCELNFDGADAPKFSMWDQAAKDQLQAARDKSNYDAGARFTNSYWSRSYGYQEGDLQPSGAPAGGSLAPAFAEGGTAPGVSPVAAEISALESVGDVAFGGLVDQLQALVDRAGSLAELQTAMVGAYGGLDSDQLVKLMSAAFALAELKGMDAAGG